MKRHWDLNIGIVGGYYVKCHCCGEVHDSKVLCKDHRNAMEIQAWLKAVKKVKEADNG